MEGRTTPNRISVGPPGVARRETGNPEYEHEFAGGRVHIRALARGSRAQSARVSVRSYGGL